MRISSQNLIMESPKYDGFGTDGTRYQFRARDALTDLKMSGLVRLNEIDGDLVQQTGVVTKVKASWGTFDQKRSALELYERINIDGSTGLRARLTRATVNTKENVVTSDEPVIVEMPTARIRAKTMALNTKRRQVRFKGDVDVRLVSSQTAGKEAGARPAKPTGTQATGLAAMLSPDAPVDVRSDILDIDDNAKTARFQQNVLAKQGDTRLSTPELEVVYEGRAENAVAGQQAARESTTRLKLLKARGGVVMTQKDDRATSQTLDYDAASERAVLRGDVVLTSTNDRRATSAVAEFDQAGETALLTGDVVVTQGKNVMKGQRLFIEQKAGHTRLESPAQAGQPSGRIAATFYRAEPKPDEGASRKAAAKAAAKPTPAEIAAGALPLGAAFKTDPSAPIDVDADTLDVFDQSKIAVFKGGVRAQQGDFIVRSEELTAHYTGRSGLSATQGEPKADSKESTQITKIEARQKVVITSGDGRTVTGSWADFDVKSNTAVVGGKVVVSQGQSVVEGTKLLIDMNTGQSRFETAQTPTPGASSDAAGGTAAASCPEGQVCKGRIRAVFYPKEAEAAKKQKGGAEPDSKPDAAGKPSPGVSSWSSTTRRPGAE
jgi:LPS export ABC transporter protein LptC/lipopolysaccharide transport protein LptA